MPRLIRESAGLILSAALFVLPYHFPALGPLAFFALVPAFSCLREKSAGQAFKRFFLLGFLYNCALGYWLTNVNVFGFLLLAAYLALYFALFGVYARGWLQTSRLRHALFAAALWTLLEYLRSLLISGFPWALAGYSQWKNLWLIQAVDITGAYGLSFFVVWVNVMLHRLMRPPFSRRHLLVLAAAFAALLGYGAWQLQSREAFYRDGRPKAELMVSVLQGNIPQDQKWDARIKGIIFEKYKRLTAMAAMEKADLIVWPETSFPGYLEDEAIMAAHLRNLVRHLRTYVLVGAPTIGDMENKFKAYNSAVLYASNGEETKRYHKEHLVPFGEYIPFEPLLGFLRHLVPIGHFSPGGDQGLFAIVSQYRPIRIAARFSVLICYEDIFSELVRQRCLDGADFLVNISNDAWFGKTSAPYQHAQASVFRAVENRVPVLRATNTGYSCFISAEGRVYSSVKTDGEEIMVSGIKTDRIVLRHGRSFFTRTGDLFFLLVLAGLMGWAWREKQRQSGYSRI